MGIRNVNRNRWSPGPWDEEDDEELFVAHGLPCLMRRAPHSGAWLGYVTVPVGHALHGDRGHSIDVHGGVTFADADGTGWRFGFDCNHGWDLSPTTSPEYRSPDAAYRDTDYVRSNVIGMARQLAAATGEE